MRFKILCRSINDFGIHPLLGISGILAVAYFSFNHLISQVSGGVYFSFGLYLLVLFNLLKHEDLDIIKLNLKSKYLILFIEALALSILPTVILLKNDYLNYVYIAVVIILLFPFLSFNYQTTFLNKVNLSILMPDYEWIFGFRKYILVHVVAVIILIIGTQVNNPNLSIGGVLLFFLALGQNYAYIEKKELIFHHSNLTTEFINLKTKSVLKKTCLFALPFLLVISIFFTDQIQTYISVFIAIPFLVTNQMLSKYAKIHNALSISLFQGGTILIALISCFYPYFLIFNILLMGYLHRESIQTTKQLFHD